MKGSVPHLSDNSRYFILHHFNQLKGDVAPSQMGLFPSNRYNIVFPPVRFGVQKGFGHAGSAFETPRFARTPMPARLDAHCRCGNLRMAPGSTQKKVRPRNSKDLFQQKSRIPSNWMRIWHEQVWGSNHYRLLDITGIQRITGYYW